MTEHRLVIWEPQFRKYVSDYLGEEEGRFGPNDSWSTSYLKREHIHKPDMASNHYECDEEAAREHVRLKSERSEDSV